MAGPKVLAGLFGLVGLVMVAWAVFVNDPLGGEPVAIVPTKKAETPKAKAATKPTPAMAGSRRNENDAAKAMIPAAKPDATKAADGKTITIIDGSNGKSQNITIPSNEGSANLGGPDQGLFEPTRHGPIPKIGVNGARAAVVYARPRSVPPDRKNFPRIAIVIDGVGISASGTAAAFKALPAAVTFAVAPYGTGLKNLVAKAGNHELLLQMPMEPFDYPDNDPGPQTLLTTLSGEQNIDRLHWLMSRFSRYVGVVNYMGGRFTASDEALRPILNEVGKRGLIYVDDGSSSRSVAGQIAGSNNLPFAKADVVLDALPSATEIDRALAHLELVARSRGSAIGIANAEPTTIARIAEWAKAVESRGFMLVPITMATAKAKSS